MQTTVLHRDESVGGAVIALAPVRDHLGLGSIAFLLSLGLTPKVLHVTDASVMAGRGEGHSAILWRFSGEKIKREFQQRKKNDDCGCWFFFWIGCSAELRSEERNDDVRKHPPWKAHTLLDVTMGGVPYR